MPEMSRNARIVLEDKVPTEDRRRETGNPKACISTP